MMSLFTCIVLEVSAYPGVEYISLIEDDECTEPSQCALHALQRSGGARVATATEHTQNSHSTDSDTLECIASTGVSCNFGRCDASTQSVCTWVTLGHWCECTVGQCLHMDGKCWATPTSKEIGEGFTVTSYHHRNLYLSFGRTSTGLFVFPGHPKTGASWIKLFKLTSSGAPTVLISSQDYKTHAVYAGEKSVCHKVSAMHRRRRQYMLTQTDAHNGHATNGVGESEDMSMASAVATGTLAGKCKDFANAGDCGWTRQWSCPKQSMGSRGLASDDGSRRYACCCTAGLWKQDLSLQASHRRRGYAVDSDSSSETHCDTATGISSSDMGDKLPEKKHIFMIKAAPDLPHGFVIESVDLPGCFLSIKEAIDDSNGYTVDCTYGYPTDASFWFADPPLPKEVFHI